MVFPAQLGRRKQLHLVSLCSWKKLLQFCFLLILSICCIISNQYFNTLVFMATMYFLRRRMGGWHAPYNWMCILLTTVTTFIVLYIFAPVLMRINSLTMWTLDILLILAAFRTNPIYPPQLHFEQEIISSNRKKRISHLSVLQSYKSFLSSLGSSGTDF